MAKSAWRRPVDGALAVRDLRYCNTIKGILVAGSEHDGEEQHTDITRSVPAHPLAPQALFDVEVAL
jgi:hypothetical protein